MMTVFSLIACFTATYAWFAAKRSQNEGVDSFSVGSDNSDITTISCYAIKYDGVYGASAIRLVSGQANNIVMSEYDYILRDKNINTPLFLRIEITGFDENKDLQITIPATGSYYEESSTHIANKLSNVVCARFSYGLQSGGNVVADNYSLTEVVETGANVTAIYKGMRDRVASINGTPFVVNSTTKNNSLTLTLSHTDVYQNGFILPYGDPDVGKVVVYICFDYYVTNTVNLVEDYVESYDGDHSNNFTCDIGTITLRDVG